jgi:hypothetical protein
MAIFETEYDAVWIDMYTKRQTLHGKRDELEAELSDVKQQIAHLNEILSHLGTLAGIPTNQDITKMGITDAVRWVMSRDEVDRMSANDVRDALSSRGYDLSGLTAPMSSIYKILSRLSGDDEKAELIREKDEEGKVFYRWKKKPTEVPVPTASVIPQF